MGGRRTDNALAAMAILVCCGSLTRTAVHGFLWAFRMAEDGRWTEFWGGHLMLHLGGTPHRLPWSELMVALASVEVLLGAIALAAMLGVRAPRPRAAACLTVAALAHLLVAPVAWVGNEGRHDEPSSVDVHLFCHHPVDGVRPGWIAISQSWFAGC